MPYANFARVISRLADGSILSGVPQERLPTILSDADGRAPRIAAGSFVIGGREVAVRNIIPNSGFTFAPRGTAMVLAGGTGGRLVPPHYGGMGEPYMGAGAGAGTHSVLAVDPADVPAGLVDRIGRPRNSFLVDWTTAPGHVQHETLYGTKYTDAPHRFSFFETFADIPPAWQNGGPFTMSVVARLKALSGHVTSGVQIAMGLLFPDLARHLSDPDPNPNEVLSGDGYGLITNCPLLTLTSTYQRFAWSSTIPQRATNAIDPVSRLIPFLDLVNWPSSGGTKFAVEIACLQLEAGSVATDYADLDKEVEAVRGGYYYKAFGAGLMGKVVQQTGPGVVSLPCRDSTPAYRNGVIAPIIIPGGNYIVLTRADGTTYSASDIAIASHAISPGGGEVRIFSSNWNVTPPGGLPAPGSLPPLDTDLRIAVTGNDQGVTFALQLS